MSSEQKPRRRHRFPSTDERVRYGIVNALGRIGDARGVDTLITLLGDEDQYTTEVAKEALVRIGEPAIDPLLRDVLDPGRSLDHRCLSLEVVKLIGTRRQDVSDALKGLLLPEQEVPARLRRQSLFVAARLRDEKQAPYAVAALSSDDWQTVCGAAKLLIEVPAPDALPKLQSTLERWTSAGAEPFDRKYVAARVIAAIVRAGQREATESSQRALEQAIQDTGILDPEDAVGVMIEQDFPGTRSLLLRYLLGRLNQSRPRFLNRDIITFLSASWQPTHLNELNSAARDLEAKETDVAATLVSAALLEKSDGEDGEVEDAPGHRLPEEPTLYTMAKAQASNFVPEAGRLLQGASMWLSEHVCEALWVANDSRAEEALLVKFERALADENLKMLREPLVRALGTCGAKTGGEAVLSYLRSDQFEIFMPTETLPTLVRRGWLSQSQLSAVAGDEKVNPHGRKECVLALGRLDAVGNRDLFRDVMFAEGEVRLRMAAVRMLGSARDAEAVDSLRRLLRATDKLNVASEAAEVLSWLRAHDAVPDIEYALGKFGTNPQHASYFATPLGRLGQTSHVPLVIEAFYKSRPIDYGLTEDLVAFLPDPRAERVILEQLETSRGMYRDAGEQAPAVRALASYDPNLLLRHVLRLSRDGRLDPRGRLELANRMHHISGWAEIDRGMLVEVFKMLICDWYLPARESALQALGWVGAAVSGQVYEELYGAPDDWTRACAATTLGFHGEEGHLLSARSDESMFVRAAADVALEVRHRRAALRQLADLYPSEDNLVRLSAYLSIKHAGDEMTLWHLDKTVDEKSFARILLGELRRSVKARLKKDREERSGKVKTFVNSDNEVRFDSPPF